MGVFAGSIGVMMRETMAPSGFLILILSLSFVLTLLVSCFSDFYHFQNEVSAIAGILLTGLLLIYFVLDLSWLNRMLIPPCVLLMSLMALNLVSTLANESRIERAFLASLGTAIGLATGIATLILGLVPTFPFRSSGTLYGALFLVCLLVIILQGWLGRLSDRVEEVVDRSFLRDSLFQLFKYSTTRRDLITFMISVFLIVASIAILASNTYQFAANRLGLQQWDSVSWALLFAAPIGAGFALIPLRELGAKRSFVLVILIWLGFVISAWFAHTDWERSLLHISFALVFGMLVATAAAFQAAITPREKSAQLLSVFAFFASLGLVSGIWLFVSANPEYAIEIALVMTAVGLYLLQLTRASRAAAVIEGRPITLRLDDVEELDWQDLDGLSKHTLLSRFSQILARILIELFFGRVRVIGLNRLSQQHGAILVANHPNTFLDPLLLTALSPTRLHYLAKSTIWRIPFLGSALDRLGAIPVMRRQDHPEMDQDANANMFEVASQKLIQGAHILVFPEGVSQPGLSLKPVKTGTVRLAKHVLSHPEWQGPVPVIPIGIDYAEPSIFRSSITIRVGEAIEISDPSPQRDDVQQTSQQISDELRLLIPHLEAKELEILVHQIQALYGSHLDSALGLDDPQEARLKIAEAVNHYHRMDPDTVKLFQQRMQVYSHQASQLATPENHEPLRIRDLWSAFLTLMSPTTIGLLSNWIPYRLTGAVVDRLSLGPVWRATAKLSIGLFVYALYYGAVAVFIGLTVSTLLAYWCVLFLAGTGLMALGAIDRYAFRIQQLTTIWRAFWTQDTDSELDDMRVRLIQDLERFRESYAFYNQGASQ